jgi:acyl dehydratase
MTEIKRASHKSIRELETRIGQELAVSDWTTVSQERINGFADATGDHQWIHVDTKRAATESPLKTTIAHGYLTLSLLAGFNVDLIQFEDVSHIINYGLGKTRFITPVPSGSRVRARFSLKEFAPREDGSVAVTWGATIELEDRPKPACVAEMLFIYYPKNT